MPDRKPLDYHKPTEVDDGGGLVMLSELAFVVNAVAFVPLHAFIGRSVVVGMLTAAGFLIGVLLAAIPAAKRKPRRTAQARTALVLNAAGVAGVVGYFALYWTVLEPLR